MCIYRQVTELLCFLDPLKVINMRNLNQAMFRISLSFLTLNRRNSVTFPCFISLRYFWQWNDYKSTEFPTARSWKWGTNVSPLSRCEASNIKPRKKSKWNKFLKHVTVTLSLSKRETSPNYNCKESTHAFLPWKKPSVIMAGLVVWCDHNNSNYVGV